MNLQPLDVYQGTNQTLTLFARNASNGVQSLTGMTLAWRVGYPPIDPNNPDSVLTKTGTISSASAGSYTVAIVPADTTYLEGDYLHETFATLTSTGVITVVNRGRFRVRPILVPV